MEEDHDLDFEKARLLSLALEFGFDEELSRQCLDQFVFLYGSDGESFITLENCGDDYLSALADSVPNDEDWDDLQPLESEAFGALSSILGKNLSGGDLKAEGIFDGSNDNNKRILTSPQLPSDHAKADVKPSRKSDSRRHSSNQQGAKISNFFQNSQTPSAKSNGRRQTVEEQTTISFSSTVWDTKQTCLGYEELNALDDVELANVVIFGNRSFRPLQHQACRASMCQKDCFILLPTGGGKSLCYQLPAALKPGITVVVCPLLSLIQDQIVTLNLKFGIPATFLNSQQTSSQAAAVIQELRKDNPSCKLLYVTPERLAGNISFAEILNFLYQNRFVIHNTLSKSIESYYQESGRAGRDNISAFCIVLYQKKDFSRVVCMLRNSQGCRSEGFKIGMEQARKMQHYCELKDDCRRQLLLEHFGEHFKREHCIYGVSPCDNCLTKSKSNA